MMVKVFKPKTTALTAQQIRLLLGGLGLFVGGILLHSNSRAVGSIAISCSAREKEILEKSLFHNQSISDATHCPVNEKWIADYIRNYPVNDDFTAIYFGCNKGYDAVETAQIVSRKKDIFNKAAWKAALQIDHDGVCFQANSESSLTADESLPQRSVEVHCVEAM